MGKLSHASSTPSGSEKNSRKRRKKMSPTIDRDIKVWAGGDRRVEAEVEGIQSIRWEEGHLRGEETIGEIDTDTVEGLTLLRAGRIDAVGKGEARHLHRLIGADPKDRLVDPLPLLRKDLPLLRGPGLHPLNPEIEERSLTLQQSLLKGRTKPKPVKVTEQ